MPTHARARAWSRHFSLLLLSLLSLSLNCNRTNGNSAPVRPPVITFIGWGPATQRELFVGQDVFGQFSHRTGVRVEYIPKPESITERLELYRQYLGNSSPTPDVYYVNVVWPAVLADQMVDLNQYLRNESADQIEPLIQNSTVGGKLTGMPFNTELGVLYYRADLLRKYGYKNPPATWDELEQMATRVQNGERSAGNH